MPAPTDAPVWADILIDEDGLKVMQRVRLYSVVVVEGQDSPLAGDLSASTPSP